VIPTVGFVNAKAGVGTTTLAYHLAWMYADLGYQVLAVDADPQADLTAAMVDEDRLAALWSPGSTETLYGVVAPIIAGADGMAVPHREPIAPRLELLVGDLAIAGLDDELSTQWMRCLDRPASGFRASSAFQVGIQRAAEDARADVVLVDLGPSLGAIHRAALLACHHVIVPVAPDLFSLQGLRLLGASVSQWRDEWRDRSPPGLGPELGSLVSGMSLAGYVVLQHAIDLGRAPHAPSLWVSRVAPNRAVDWTSVIPDVFATATGGSDPAAHPDNDPHCLGLLKRYGSLMPMAQEARKPIFHLRPGDGALGAHATAAREARKDFEEVANRIAAATWRPGKRPRPRTRS
jgi:cellulose biosynthesis protein BcsQ